MGKNLTRQSFDVNSSWTCPAGVTSAKIMAFSRLNPQIAFGAANQHILTPSGAAYGMGVENSSAANGQLGTGTAGGIGLSVSTPTLVAGSYSWRQIARSLSGGVGITTAGLAYTWGGNAAGELGTATVGSTTSFQSSPVAVVGGFTWRQIAGGSSNGIVGGLTTTGSYYLGLTTSGVAYAWGANFAENLGTGDSTNVGANGNARSSPTIVTGGLTWKKLAAGGGTSLGITTSGAAYAWGNNSNGQLGNGTSGNSVSTPVAVSGGYTFIEIATALSSCYGITNTNDLYAWGDNTEGQLGLGDTTQRGSPTLVLGGFKWRKVVAGCQYAMGITTSGDAYAWGNNSSGQLGNSDASLVSKSSPVLVVGGLKWRSLAADPYFFTSFGIGQASSGISTNGNAYSWGNNLSGQLGNNANGTSFSSPILVYGGTTWNSLDSQLLGEQIIAVIPGTTYPVTLFAGLLQFGPSSLYGDSPAYVGSVPAAIIVEYFS